MITATAQPAALPPDGAELWFPPGRMRRYQAAKVVGGLLMILIFGGWMLLQWESHSIRWLSGILTILTVWIVAVSILNDARRTRGRQLAIRDGRLQAVWPQGQANVSLSEVAYARWRADAPATAGLWLFAAQDRALIHLDLNYFADEAEARQFVGWARRLSGASLETRWA